MNTLVCKRCAKAWTPQAEDHGFTTCHPCRIPLTFTYGACGKFDTGLDHTVGVTMATAKVLGRADAEYMASCAAKAYRKRRTAEKAAS